MVLDPEQVELYDLPEAFDAETLEKLERDDRGQAFIERFGALTQVELDALPVDVLRELFTDRLAEYSDMSAYNAALDLEEGDRDELTALLDEDDQS